MKRWPSLLVAALAIASIGLLFADDIAEARGRGGGGGGWSQHVPRRRLLAQRRRQHGLDP